MNPNNLSSDDPKLTAYALGELDTEENARIAQMINADVVAQAAVEEIRCLSAQLEEALANEAAWPTMNPELPVPPRASIARAKWPVYWVSGLAAACFLVIMASRSQVAPLPTVERARGMDAQATAQRTSDATSSKLRTDSIVDQALPPFAVNRKRGLSPDPSDVKPAPLRDDGLQLWRSLTDNRAGAGSPDSLSQPGPGEEREGTAGKTLYPGSGYKGGDMFGSIDVAVSQNPATEGYDRVPVLDETVPLSAIEAANAEVDTQSPNLAEARSLAESEPPAGELPALKIQYKMPAVELAQRVELPRIDLETSLALLDQDFRRVFAAAGLGRKLQEAPHKNSSYDQILTWAEENQDPKETSAEPRRESVDAIKKSTRATVE